LPLRDITVSIFPALTVCLASPALLATGALTPASAAFVPPPANLSAAISTSRASVPADGGELVVHVTIHGASTCHISISPHARVTPAGRPCHNLDNTYRASFATNPQLRPRRFVLTVLAEGARGIVEQHHLIMQARAPNLIDNYTRVPSYGLYGNGENDAVGDCTLAAAGDLLQTWDAMNGAANGPLATQPFLDAYHTLVGGPGGPDIGLTARQVLNFWQRRGIDNNLISSWRSVAAYRNPAAIEDAVARNGAIYASVALPSTDTSFLALWSMVEAPYGTPVAGGHALAIIGYDARGPYFATWGGVQHATWQWWKTWGTGAYVVIPGKAPWNPNVVIPTSTLLSQSVTTASINGVSMYALNLVARVSGVTGPTIGTITFSDNGQPIAGCSALPAVVSGSATVTQRCTEYISSASFESDTLFAQFSGDSTFGDSTSNPILATFG